MSVHDADFSFLFLEIAREEAVVLKTIKNQLSTVAAVIDSLKSKIEERNDI